MTTPKSSPRPRSFVHSAAARRVARAALASLALGAIGCAGLAPHERGETPTAGLCEVLCDEALGASAVGIMGDDGSCSCLAQDSFGNGTPRLLAAHILPVVPLKVASLAVQR